MDLFGKNLGTHPIRWFEEEMHSQASQGKIENGKENDITHPPHFPVLPSPQQTVSFENQNNGVINTFSISPLSFLK